MGSLFNWLLIVAALAIGSVSGGLRPAEAAAGPVKLVVLGDSLSAGYQLPAADAFPAKLQAALIARGLKVEVENAGVSGDTTTGGLERLDWSVGEGTEAVILELGANDALRGIDPAITRRNLDAILARLTERGIAVLVTGMMAPPNMGAVYAQAFNPIFAELAAKHGQMLDPFFLDGVAAEPQLNLADGMHPNSKGVDVIVARILPQVEALIRTVEARRGS